MSRLAAILLTALLLVVGLTWADDDGPDKKAPPDGVPRLKRKKRAPSPPDVKPPVGPDKDKEKPGPKDRQPGKEKEKEAEEAIVPEDGDGEPEEDDKDVLERLATNLRSVEEKLGNRELGEPTRQQQSDILKDIDSLIRRKQQGGGGGGANQPPPQGGADQGEQDQKQGGAQQKQGGGGSSERRTAGRGKQRGQRNARASRRPRQGRGTSRSMAGRQPRPTGSQQPSPRPENERGKTSDSPDDRKNPKTELGKGYWGHLPESVRAQMDAYSNPQPFMPRYDDLVKKYYRTIAEQGRKKGD